MVNRFHFEVEYDVLIRRVQTYFAPDISKLKIDEPFHHLSNVSIIKSIGLYFVRLREILLHPNISNYQICCPSYAVKLQFSS